MLFSSITFLYVFLPAVLVLYFIAPKKVKNYVLLAASLVFYAWGEPRYVLIMLAQITAGYIFGLLIGRFHGKAPEKWFLGASILFDLCLLGYFKYADFFIDTFGKVTGLPVKLLGIALPIGISFYTFQIISYSVDVYRGEVPPQKNPFTLATYVAMFPQLIAGPIVRYIDVAKQLEDRQHTIEGCAKGARRFVFGLAKKILIANALGELCNIFRTAHTVSVGYYWLYAIAFTLHIYFDFSGYSDMAIGLGKIFGFDFLENFNYPYISGSITEFWRRWHMSLGGWFRDYVYIPLGGNRVSKGKWLRNILIVWFLTGFWHGAAWNFIVWGLFYGGILLIEKFFLLDKLKKAKVINHIYVMLMVIIGFVIFNASDLGQAISDLGGMIGIRTVLNDGRYVIDGMLPLMDKECAYYLASYAFVLMLAIVGATPLPKNVIGKIALGDKGKIVLGVMEPIVLIVMMVVMTAYLVDGSFNPFLYFRF